MDATHRIQALTPDESVRLLDTAEVGRVVFTDHALPAILPVTFIVDRESIVIRTARGSRLARAADGAVLAFEADELLPGHAEAWSVVVTGQASMETRADELERLDGLLTPWVPGVKDIFIRIPLTVVTGRLISGRPAARPHRTAAVSR